MPKMHQNTLTRSPRPPSRNGGGVTSKGEEGREERGDHCCKCKNQINAVQFTFEPRPDWWCNCRLRCLLAASSRLGVVTWSAAGITGCARLSRQNTQVCGGNSTRKRYTSRTPELYYSVVSSRNTIIIIFRTRSSALNMTLSLSTDICCRRRRSAANPPAAVAAVDRWDRQMDARPLHRPCSV